MAFLRGSRGQEEVKQTRQPLFLPQLWCYSLACFPSTTRSHQLSSSLAKREKKCFIVFTEGSDVFVASTNSWSTNELKKESYTYMILVLTSHTFETVLNTRCDKASFTQNPCDSCRRAYLIKFERVGCTVGGVKVGSSKIFNHLLFS